jgi:hypothetical protein
LDALSGVAAEGGEAVNDAEFEEQKARIQKLEARWISTLGLEAWKLNTVFVRGDFTSDGDPALDTVATAKTVWQYMLATVSWNIPQVAEHSDRELERIFLHEYMHVFLNELRPLRIAGEDARYMSTVEGEHEERVATMLGNAFLWTRESVLKEVKDTKARKINGRATA